MKVFDFGNGPPLVVIPGIQGRWEWVKPGVDALAERCRVITFSLCDEPCSEARYDERDGFGCYLEQVRNAMDQAGLTHAAICGISYGGLIAAAFAARYPARTSSLILVSALSPSWTPNSRIRAYMNAPRLYAGLFWIGSPFRLYPEFTAALPNLFERARIGLAYGWRVIAHRPSARRMSLRAKLVTEASRIDLSSVRAPTLIVTGEPALDRVVPVSTTHEYSTLIPHAQHVVLERTGHVGIVTRPHALADLVAPFVERSEGAPSTEAHRHAV